MSRQLIAAESVTCTVHLSALHLYPVKSLRGCPVTAARIDALGLVGDRRFMVVDSAGQFLTQRTLPRLARIATSLDLATLTLSADEVGAISLATAGDAAAPTRRVSVWKSQDLLAEDCGKGAAEWLSTFLARECRLVRIGRDFRRPVRHQRIGAAPGAEPLVGFADAYPFLVVGEASLADLNSRLAAQGSQPLPMDRFRPNLVIAGSAPYEEDRWERFQIGSIRFRAAGPCARCVVTTTDQSTAERGPEPLRTLASYRRGREDPSEVHFGQNLIHETTTGQLEVGQPVTFPDHSPTTGP